MRNKARSWRLLGIIPDVALTSKATKQATYQSLKKKGRHVRDIHTCLDVILKSVRDALPTNPDTRDGAIVIKHFGWGYSPFMVRWTSTVAFFGFR